MSINPQPWCVGLQHAAAVFPLILSCNMEDSLVLVDMGGCLGGIVL